MNKRDLIKCAKWEKVGSYWYSSEHKGHKVDLRWFKERIAVSIDEGEWARYYGRYRLWEAKSKALCIVENFIHNGAKGDPDAIEG